MFNESSVVVKTWVNKVRSGEYTLDQVPRISNLKEMVISELNKVD